MPQNIKDFGKRQEELSEPSQTNQPPEVLPPQRNPSEEASAQLWQSLKTIIGFQNQAPSLIPVSRESNLPLSFPQERLWFIEQLESANSSYHIPLSFRLTGLLEISALEQSFNEILRRHEALRTTFASVESKPVQIISPNGSLPLRVVDLCGLPVEARETQLMQLASESAEQPFDLSQEAPFRALLFKLRETEHVLLVNVHHIAFDGWSEGILLRELAVLYEAFSSGKPSPLPELPVQYPDFAVWQRQWLQGEFLEALLSYWKQQLGSKLHELRLPIDHPRPAKPTRRSACQKLALPPELSNAIKSLSRQQGTTLFATLLAAFQVLLHHYTKQDDLFVCSPVANRNRKELKGLIGYFVNLLILRSDLSGDPSFQELLARVRQVVSGAVAHQDLPVQQLVNNPEVGLTSLSQVMFVLQNTPQQKLELSGLTVSSLELDSGTTDFDLFLSMVEEAGTLTGVLKYNTDLFDAATIKQMLEHFQTVLEQIVTNPEQPLSSLLPLSEGQQQKLQEGRARTLIVPSVSVSGECVVPQTTIERQIVEVWQEVLGVEQVGIYDNFFEIGGRSLLLVQVYHKLREIFEQDFSPVDLFTYPTISALAKYFSQQQTQQAPTGESNKRLGQKKERQRRQKPHDSKQLVLDGIAIIGMAGRFPGAGESIDKFWQNLRDGIESVSFFTDEELLAAGVNPKVLSDPNYIKAGSVVEDIEMFDASFFGFSPKVAALLDPQQRILLECSWQALENAGYDSEKYDGRIGVYGGGNFSTYWHNHLLPNQEFVESAEVMQVETGNDKDFIATRISYNLNLTGPSVAINTACSTSLVAVHLACQALLQDECDLALAGGITILVPHKVGYLYQEGSYKSPDGHCRAFDAKARGTVFGSGAGLVVLKRLEEALTDGDCIYAVIKGSALNNDGSLKVGFTAPSVDGQAEVIAEAQAMAGIDPETITYIETHGTGTASGDPIEIAGLTKAFRTRTDKKGFCAIASVKANIGHLNRAAGVVGLIKTALALQHQTIPPSINFEEPNSQIDFENSPFYVNTTLQPWPSNGTPRRAGISAFGVGGTNAHAVLEEAPVTQPSGPSRPWQLLMLSAQSETALETATQNLVKHLQDNNQLNLADVAFTLQVGRRTFNHRRVLVCQNQDEAIATLATTPTNFQKLKQRPVVFMFTGQGAQYVNMAQELYQVEPLFREQVDYCAKLLKPHLELDLREVIYPQEDGEAAAQLLKQTRITQPALFVIEYALAQLWMSWGVHPEAMIGHSIGEYVAATLAGVFSLEDALVLVADRGRLMQQLPGGSMLTVFLPEEEVYPLLNENLSLATCNGPSLCTVAGPTVAVEALRNQLTEQGIDCRPLHTSHAFHSQMMEPILGEFAQRVGKVTLNPPQLPYISNLSGTWITATEATDPHYWAKHLRQTVRFAAGVKELLQDETQILLEVGPGQMLKSLAQKQASPEQVVLSSVRHPKEQRSDVEFLLNTLGQLWLAGVTPDWSGFYANERRRRLPLPTYPFQRQRHWVEFEPAKARQAKLLSTASRRGWHPLLGQRLHLAGTQQIRFEAQISSDFPAFLQDHCLFQTAILPGAAYMEMALAAGAAVLKSDNLQVENVVIRQAMVLPQDAAQTVQLILTPQGNQEYSFEIFSLNEQNQEEPSWTLHASGKVLLAAQNSEPPQVDLTALQALCTEEQNVASYYQKFRDRGIEYGPNFQGIKKLWRYPGTALGQVQLADALVSETEKFQLHPALLDASFQVLVTALPDEGEEDTFIPVGLASLRVYHRPGSRLWSHAQLLESNSQSKTVQLRLLDESGTVVAEVEKLSLKRVSQEIILRSIHKDLTQWLYELTWQPQASQPKPPSEKTNWLIFADQGGIGQKLAESLKARGDSCVLVWASQTYEKSDAENYYLNPAEPGDFQKLLQDVAESVSVVHLWSLEATLNTATSLSDLENAQVKGCASVLHLVQALSQTEMSHRLLLVTQGAQSVGVAPVPLQVQQATLWGLGRVIDLEHPDLNCVRLDLDPTGGTETTDALLAQLWSTDEENQVAYRQGVRHVARLVRRPTSPKKTQQPLVTPEGSYLLTGGLGGLGLKVAHWLVNQGARHLVLTGRSGITEKHQEALRQLEQLGAKVLVVKADVSNPEDVARVLAEAKASLPTLRGVIHAAGVIDDGILLQQNWERWTKVMAPKLRGSWNLHALTQDLPLDFFVCFSSIAALLGSPGQGNYAAANTFMDALAAHRRSLGLPGLSVNWGAWADVGMAASLESRHQRQMAAQGMSSITPEQGVRLLGELIEQGATQVGVLPVNWSQFVQRFPSRAYSAVLSELEISAVSPEQPQALAAQSAAILQQLQQATPEERPELLLTYLQERIAQFLKLTAAQRPTPEQSLNELGVDSLMAIEFRGKLKTELGVDLTTEKLIGGNSIQQITSEMLELLASTSLTLSESAADRQESTIDLLLAPVPRNGNLPVSFAQERLWTIEQLQPGSPVHNLGGAFRLKGLLNLEALARSLGEVGRRHEVLRTNVLLVDGQPVQRISDHTLKLSVIDLQHLEEAEREIQAQQLINEAVQQPFDLAEEPLLRLQVLRLAAADNLLLLTVHHIVFDNWSLGLFLQELSTLYQSFIAGESLPLPELPIQYADFAYCHRQWLQGKVLESQLDYWQEQLKGSSALELPTDYPQPLSPSYQGSYEVLTLSKSFTEAFRALMQKEGVTLYVALLAAFKTLLHYYTGQEDVIMCSPVASRNQEEIKQLIGYFNNILPIRTDLSGNPSFRELLRRVRQVTSQAFEHQDVPFQMLGDLPNITLGKLFRVMFNVLKSPTQSLELPGIAVTPVDVHNGTANFDLSFFIYENQETIKGILYYKTDLFEATTIIQLLQHYQSLLESIVVGLEQPLESLLPLTEAEQQELSQRRVNHQVLLTNQQAMPEQKKTYIAPRNPVELKLTQLWEQVLGIHQVGIQDNFFELGGQSLQAMSLFTQIEKTFGKILPLATLLQAPTVEQLARLLGEQGEALSWSSLVPIQPHGSKPPFFCVHGLRGNVIKYLDVAKYLDPEQPFYGLQARGLDGKQAPHTCLKDMAAHYLQEIRSVQPQGPYYLGGYSMGGDIAFEIAQQLHKQNQAVGLLVMFDSFGKGSFPRLLFRGQNYGAYLRQLGLSRTLYQELRFLIKSKLEEATGKLYLRLGRPLPHKLQSSWIALANTTAGTKYVPQAYPGQVTLFRAQEPPRFTKLYLPTVEDWYSRDLQHGWGRLAKGGVVIHDVPGHHHSMFEEPNIQVVAEQLQACLDKAQAKYSAEAATLAEV